MARGASSQEKDWNDPIGLGGGEAERRWRRARLDDLLEGTSRMAFMLRFTLSHPDLHTTIVGTSKLAHCSRTLPNAELGPLPADVYQEAKERLGAADSVSL